MKGNNNQLEKNTQPKGETTMKNKMNKVLKNEKGLTLIELLAVIVILAIVAAIAIPAIGNIVSAQRDKATLANTSTILSGAKLAYSDGACSSDSSNEVCSQTELADYVEGIETAANSTTDYSVEKKTTGWEVTYVQLKPANFKSNKFTKYFTTNPVISATDNTITEKELNTAMGQ